MSNSPLATYTNLSPNCTKPRNHVIDTLTPHVVVGQVTSKWIADYFTDPSIQASPNYGIGKDGDISLCVEECNRSWCTSSRSNDHRAITVEIASDKNDPWAITDKALAALIDLFTDVCKRNGKNKVIWIDDKEKALAYNPASNEMIITVHRWFDNKSCPGPYVYERLGYIRDEINKRLASEPVKPSAPAEKVIYRVQTGAFRVKQYADDYLKTVKAKFPDAYMVYADKMYRIQVGAFSVKANADNYLKTVKAAGFSCFLTTKGGQAVSADPEPAKVMKVGSVVRVKQGAKDYAGNSLMNFVYTRNHVIKSISGDRVVITYNGVVVAAVNKNNLTLVG